MTSKLSGHYYETVNNHNSNYWAMVMTGSIVDNNYNSYLILSKLIIDISLLVNFNVYAE